MNLYQIGYELKPDISNDDANANKEALAVATHIVAPSLEKATKKAFEQKFKTLVIVKVERVFSGCKFL